MMLMTLAVPGLAGLDRRRAVLDLGVDQLPHGFGIFVLELLRLERARLPLDQLDGKLERFLVDLHVRHFLEEGVCRFDFIGVAQNFEQQPLPAGLERDDVALAAQNKIADADLVRLVQRLQHDGVAFFGGVAVGKEVIGLLEIAGVDCRRLDEAHELDGLLALELQLVDLLLVEQDVFALLVLVALDDVLVLDRADAGATFW